MVLQKNQYQIIINSKTTHSLGTVNQLTSHVAAMGGPFQKKKFTHAIVRETGVH